MDTPPPEPLTESLTRGPVVGDGEVLYRAVPPKAAAVQFPRGRPSSMLFAGHPTSVDMASLTTVEAMLARWPEGTVIVSFSHSDAKAVGFSVHHEPENGNIAHAHVYSDLPVGTTASQRKKMAAKLADRCVVVHPPPASPVASQPNQTVGS